MKKLSEHCEKLKEEVSLHKAIIESKNEEATALKEKEQNKEACSTAERANEGQESKEDDKVEIEAHEEKIHFFFSVVSNTKNCIQNANDENKRNEEDFLSADVELLKEKQFEHEGVIQEKDEKI